MSEKTDAFGMTELELCEQSARHKLGPKLTAALARVAALEAENKERAETNSLLRRQLSCMTEVVEDLVGERKKNDLFIAKVREGGPAGTFHGPLAPLVLGEMDRLAEANARLEAEVARSLFDRAELYNEAVGLRTEKAELEAEVAAWRKFGAAYRAWHRSGGRDVHDLEVQRLCTEATGEGVGS